MSLWSKFRAYVWLSAAQRQYVQVLIILQQAL